MLPELEEAIKGVGDLSGDLRGAKGLAGAGEVVKLLEAGGICLI